MNPMDKWIFRQNARRKSEFGVHYQPGPWAERGASEIRHYVIHNPDHAKVLVRDTLECLKLMQTERFRAHVAEMNTKAREYYRALKVAL